MQNEKLHKYTTVNATWRPSQLCGNGLSVSANVQGFRSQSEICQLLQTLLYEYLPLKKCQKGGGNFLRLHSLCPFNANPDEHIGLITLVDVRFSMKRCNMYIIIEGMFVPSIRYLKYTLHGILPQTKFFVCPVDLPRKKKGLDSFTRKIAWGQLT